MSAPWPADPSLPPEALALPANQPNDPEFAPGLACGGQLGWLSFMPECLSHITEERAKKIGAGASIDRVWAHTIGRPSVVIAVLDTGVDFHDPEVIGRLALNPGELAPPELGSSGRHDTNGDGAFNVLDYTIATSTEGPTVASVRDRRLLVRPDHGDVDGNGWLDPGDLLAIYSDLRDDDGNGYVDDLVGWDFLEGDNDPSGPGTGPELLHLTLANANDGRTIAGVCPRCGGMALRIGARGIAAGGALQRALTYAADRGAVVAATSLGVLDNAPSLAAAAIEASRRLVIVGSQGRRIGRGPAPLDGILLVGAIGPNRSEPSSATSILAPDPNSGFGAGLGLVAPAPAGPPAVALVAGTLGLLHSAASGLEQMGLAALDPPLSASEARALLIGAASDVAAPTSNALASDPLPRPKVGFDERTGSGRLEAFAALLALESRRMPPSIAIVEPRPRAVIDPSDGRAVAITARVQATRARVSWRLEQGPGLEPGPSELTTLASGTVELGQTREIQAELIAQGQSLDPARPPTGPGDHAITLRLLANAEIGGMSATSEARTVIYLHRDLDIFPAFPLEIGEPVSAAPRIGDLDGDGDAELWVLSTRGALYSISPRGTVVDHGAGPGRAFTVPSLIVAGEGDGRSRVVWATVDGAVVSSLGGAAAEIVLQPVTTTSTEAPAGQTAAPVLADLDGDGGLEVILARFDGHLLGAHLDASGPPLFDVRLDGPAGTPAVGDLDGDGRPEIVATTERSIHWLRSDGTSFDLPLRLPEATIETVDREGAFFPSPALAHLDDDGRLDVILAARGRPVLVYGSKDRRVPTFAELPRVGDDRPDARVARNSQVAVADLDDDGSLEIVQSVASLAELGRLAPEAAADPALAALGSGGPKRGFARTRFDLGALDVAILDVDGDDRSEILAPRFGLVDAFSYEGSTPRGWPKLTGGVAAGPPAIGDLDGDGRLDIAAITEDGRVFVWRGRGKPGARASWDGFHHDRHATGNLSATTLPRQVEPPTGSCGCRSTAASKRSEAWALIVALWLWKKRKPRPRSS